MKLWPTIPDGTRVMGGTSIEVLQDHRDKPVLKLTWGKTIVYITASQGEKIGGIATGAIQRYEELKNKESI